MGHDQADHPLSRFKKPTIAAVDGYCLGGGFEVALECDIRVATVQSKFGSPEPRVGLLAGYGLHNLSHDSTGRSAPDPADGSVYECRASL